MIEINKYRLTSTGIVANQGKLIPGANTYWGFIAGNITDQEDLVSWVEGHGYLTEHQPLKTVNGQSLVGTGNIDIEASVPSYYATKAWVQSQGYLTSGTLPSDIATQSWVESQGYMPESSMSAYLLKSNISNGKGIDFNPSDASIYMRTDIYHQLRINPSNIIMTVDGGSVYMIYDTIGIASTNGACAGVCYGPVVGGSTYSEHVFLIRNGSSDTMMMDYNNIYLEEGGVMTTIPFKSIATTGWVQSQGYLVSDDLSQYATRQWVVGRSYATESWVQSQGYLTAVPAGYATESWVTSQSYLTSASTMMTDIESRLSSIEATLGQAVQITNNILS